MKENITGDHVANAVRMKRLVYDCAFLLVEGQSDAAFFDTFIDHEQCRIEISCGKHNVISAIRILNAAKFPGVLGVADADFRNIDPDGVNESNLIYTDDHDIECTMLRSGALERLLSEFGIPDRVATFAERYGPVVGYSIASSASKVGHLLLVSLRNDHGLVFDALPFSRFVNPTSLSLDIGSMLTEVKNKSQKHFLDWALIEQDVAALQSMGHDPWQVCCGHHFLEMLSLAFRRTFASHNTAEVGVHILAKCLRLAYNSAEFVTTAMCRSIRDWEATNTPFQVLRLVT